jgi:tRNA(fMet)-specific endonuclease VapC
VAVLIDTSVLVDTERRGQALEAAAGDEERAISVISASELLHGVHRASKPQIQARRLAFVEHLLAALAPLPITMQVARVHAEVWAHMEASGTTIGAHDLWIAATALAHGMRVATANATDFERVPGLSVSPLA